MKRLLQIAIIFALAQRVNAQHLDSLYNVIDDAILHTEQYTASKLQRISSLQKQLSATTTSMARHNIAMSLFQEYEAFQNDSAIYYLKICEETALQMGRQDLRSLALIKIGLQHSRAGSYTEAFNYVNSVDRNTLSSSQLADFFQMQRHLYGEMASYTHDEKLKARYFKLSDSFNDSILEVADSLSDLYLSIKENVAAYNDNDFNKALEYNSRRLEMAEEGSPTYAMVAYYRSVFYKGLKEYDEAKRWLAISAICDIRNVIMNQASLWSLASMLKDDDIDRAYRYIEYSWACNSRFSSHVRSWTISPLLTMINSKYKARLNDKNRTLTLLLIIVSMLALVIAGLYLNVSKKRKQLQDANLQISDTNNQLASFNSELSSLNERLSNLNTQLTESNRIKEEYIGQFFAMCSDYIEKMDSYRLTIHRMLKARKYDEMMKMTMEPNLKERETEALNNNFDMVFLHLFPSFIDDINVLLLPEHHIEMEDNCKMPTAVRIYALIRLGIEDSYHIAQFLHYSPNTIYNYRSRLKNKAIDKDMFETNVKNIGKQ